MASLIRPFTDPKSVSCRDMSPVALRPGPYPKMKALPAAIQLKDITSAFPVYQVSGLGLTLVESVCPGHPSDQILPTTGFLRQRGFL